MRLGIDRLSYYGTKFGLGRKTGIDLPDEKEGLMAVRVVIIADDRQNKDKSGGKTPPKKGA